MFHNFIILNSWIIFHGANAPLFIIHSSFDGHPICFQSLQAQGSLKKRRQKDSKDQCLPYTAGWLHIWTHISYGIVHSFNPDGIPAPKVGSEYLVPPIPKKRFVTNTCWQREKSFFSNGVSLGTGYINHTRAQSPCPRVVGQHISNFLYWGNFLLCLSEYFLSPLFLLSFFLFSFLWVCVVLFCFIFVSLKERKI